jgi:nitrate reductase NapE component
LLFALGSIATFIVLWAVSGVRARELKRIALIDIALVPIVVAGLVAAWVN